MSEQQLDLFSSIAAVVERPVPEPARRPVPAHTLDDEALVAAIAESNLDDSIALAREAARRRLTAAVPSLEALCRRFVGFGARRMVPEQAAALDALGVIGAPGTINGREAAQAISRLIAREAVQGPALALAVSTAARIRAILPEQVLRGLLRHHEPDIRASACGCSRQGPAVIETMIELLDDLNAGVARSAACALGRIGRIEGRPLLARLLREQPCEDVIDAVAQVADEECLVQLGRIARNEPALSAAALKALEDIDHPRADAIAAAIRATLVQDAERPCRGSDAPGSAPESD